MLILGGLLLQPWAAFSFPKKRKPIVSFFWSGLFLRKKDERSNVLLVRFNRGNITP
jgi:hypothetical protein